MYMYISKCCFSRSIFSLSKENLGCLMLKAPLREKLPSIQCLNKCCSKLIHLSNSAWMQVHRVFHYKNTLGTACICGKGNVVWNGLNATLNLPVYEMHLLHRQIFQGRKFPSTENAFSWENVKRFPRLAILHEHFLMCRISEARTVHVAQKYLRWYAPIWRV